MDFQAPMTGAARRWLKKSAIQTALDIFGVTARLPFMPDMRGRGAIFTLHHVRPRSSKAFDPVTHLEITPEFLDHAIMSLKADGFRAFPLDALPGHLDAEDATPAMFFTLDDGYRDNLEFALPIFEKHEIPFTIFVTGGFIDRTRSIWWKTAEQLIAKVDRFSFDFGSGPEHFDCSSTARKFSAYERIGVAILESGRENELVGELDRVAAAHGIDPMQIVQDEVMAEAELRKLSAHPLASLGAHTISHRNMALLDEGELAMEISQSVERVQAITGEEPAAFAFPYGGLKAVGPREYAAVREAGLSLAVTTKADRLLPRAASHLHALNRISLNGFYQKPRYVRTLASGLPFFAREMILGRCR